MLKKILATSITSMAWFVGTAAACSGEACDDLVISADHRGCIYVTNHGTRRVNVKLGPVSFVVQRGQTFYPKDLGGGCLTGYVGSDSATYTN